MSIRYSKTLLQHGRKRQDNRMPQPTDLDAFYREISRARKQNQARKLSMPLYTGIAIPAYSKFNMHSFYCDVLKLNYDDHIIQFVFRDTSICVLKIVIDDVFEDPKDLSEYMDFSDFHTSHPSYDRTNKKALRKIRVSSVEDPLQVSCAQQRTERTS